MSAVLSPGEVARRLGIATTTLRTWHQRYGLGPTGHQSGRHRRYTDGDLAALTAMARLTARGVPAALAAALAEQRIGAIHLGAGLPPDAVAETVRRSRPLRR